MSNILSDGDSTYIYNHANRLTGVTGTDVSSFTYNDLGDRYQQIVNGTTTTYQLDLAAGLVNVLADGENTYLYGNTVVAQVSDTQTGYYLPDVLGSIRQMTSSTGEVQLSQRFTPFGVVKEKYGDGEANFGYTAQKYDAQTGLLYLRARYYAPGIGRFISHDTWSGDSNMPMSYNKWLYGYGNPVRYVDPSGKFSENRIMDYFGVNNWKDVEKEFHAFGRFEGDWGWLEVLRRADFGDEFYAGISGEMNGVKFSPRYRGTFRLGVLGYGISLNDKNNHNSSIDIDDILFHTYWYQVRRPNGSVKFDTFGYEQYYHLQFHSEVVDWDSVLLDSLGIIIPGVSASKLVKDGTTIKEIIDLGGLGSGIVSSLRGISNVEALKDENSRNSTICSLFGLLTSGSGPVSGGFSLAALYYDLQGFVTITH